MGERSKEQHLPVAFELASPSDAKEVFEIHQRSVRALCAPAYSPETIYHWFDDRTAAYYHKSLLEKRILLALVASKRVGFVETAPGEIIDLFVLPEFSGRGVGKALLCEGLVRALVGGANKVRIEATLNSVPFYQAAGFIKLAEGEWLSPSGQIKIPVVFMEYSLQP